MDLVDQSDMEHAVESPIEKSTVLRSQEPGFHKDAVLTCIKMSNLVNIVEFALFAQIVISLIDQPGE